MSIPILEVKRGTRLLSGQMAGRPITHSDPRIGPVRVPRPPITTIDTSRSESPIRKNRLVNGMFCTSPPSSAPPSPANPPARAKAVNFVRPGATV